MARDGFRVNAPVRAAAPDHLPLITATAPARPPAPGPTCETRRGRDVDLSISLILLQDGVVNAAIYALLALAMVLVFTVTRVIFVPIGEFVSFGALTLAALESGRVPGTIWLLGLFGAAAALATLARRAR